MEGLRISIEESQFIHLEREEKLNMSESGEQAVMGLEVVMLKLEEQ